MFLAQIARTTTVQVEGNATVETLDVSSGHSDGILRDKEHRTYTLVCDSRRSMGDTATALQS